MIPDYQKIIQEAKDRRKEVKKVMSQIKHAKPSEVNALAAELHDEVFDEIDCLKCGNCCRTTGPLFTQKDIERLAKRFRIRPGDFIEQYLRLDEEGDYVLQSVPCPFLGEDNYCSVYEDRPKACRTYPHTDHKTFHKITDITAKNTRICPAAYLVVQRMRNRLG
jgi:Fe-S-cluster containining protein